MQLASWFLLAVSLAPAQAAELSADEQTVRAAGLTADGPALLEFVRRRSRPDGDGDDLRALARELADAAAEARDRAANALIARGPVAVPFLRQAANDPSDPPAAERARQCLKWIQGPDAAALSGAAVRLVAERKPAGAAAALLAYAPVADDADVVQEVARALAAVAYPDGRPDPALVRALEDEVPLRRAVAGEALCRADRPEQLAAIRKLLDDPGPGVRLGVALALLRERDVTGVPVLIDLLADLPPAPHRQAEEALQELAGDWAPALPNQKEDAISGRIRRDAWAAWWKNTDGPHLLTEFRRRTPDDELQQKIRALVGRLGADEFSARERATADLVAVGRPSVPFLRAAAAGKDLERAHRAESCLERIARDDTKGLPTAAARLLALRRPDGAVEALLAYLPWSTDEAMSEEVQKALGSLAVRDGKPDPALVKALADAEPPCRLAAGEALARRGGQDLRPALRKLLRDPDPAVRAGVGTALVAAGDREAVLPLIDALADLPPDPAGSVVELLLQLAGAKGPDAAVGADAVGRRKCRDAWAAWWQANEARVDLAGLGSAERLLGYTLLVESSPGRVREIGRDGKTRWQIDGLQFPVDAYVLGGNRVLVTECHGNRVSERDLKGRVLWKVDGLPGSAINAQRLANGHTFIATVYAVVEVDRQGKDLLRVSFQHQPLSAAYKLRGGDVVCLTQQGQCLWLDRRGKEVRRFASGRSGGWTSGIDATPGGRVLVTRPNERQVAEVDRGGKTVWQVAVPQNLTTATWLPNGHVLAACHTQSQVVELDRAGHVAWEFRGDGQVFRARRR